MTESQAKVVRAKIETLRAEAADGGGPVDTEAARRILGRQYDKFVKKLRVSGLVHGPSQATLGAFLDQYKAGRTDSKSSTHLFYGHTIKYLKEHFGENRLMRNITEADADAFRLHLIRQGLSKSTVNRRVKLTKQYFKAAVRARIITSNPFDHIKCSSSENRAKMFFVTREMAAKVLDACPDNEWRLMFALSRYGGLRCPSEHLALKWADINWGDGENPGRITIHSSKTEHHDGKATRVIPLFDELLPYLLEAYEEPGESEWVITRTRDTAVNLRTQLLRIIARSGLAPWPKLWQNLRSSAETELAQNHPLHVVVAWLGNSQPVAMRHYLQVTDEDFKRAVRAPAKAMQNRMHHEDAGGRTEPHAPAGGPQEPAFCGSVGLDGIACNMEAKGVLGPEGFEPTSETPAKPTIPTESDAESYAPDAKNAPSDELSSLAQRLASLTHEERAKLLAMLADTEAEGGTRSRVEVTTVTGPAVERVDVRDANANETLTTTERTQEANRPAVEPA